MTHKNCIPDAALRRIGAIKDILINNDIHDETTVRNVRETVSLLLAEYDGDVDSQVAIREGLSAMCQELGIDPIKDIYYSQDCMLISK